MKQIFIITMMMTLYGFASAQNQQTVIKTEALKMAKALAAMDLETYASYSWPELVSDPQNKQRIKAAADSADKYRKQFNIKVKSIIIGNPSEVVKHKGVLQCTIPQTMAVEAMMGSIETESTLIGLSRDGKKWYFVDANFFNNKETKEKLPELSPQLIIPKQKKPVMKDADGKEIKM
jgi:ketosteroid isomerase-like protein